MSEAEVIDLIPDYVNGNLSPEESERFRQNLANYPACEEELTRYERLVDLLKNDTVEVPQAELMDRFEEAFDQKVGKEPKGKHFRLNSPLFRVAAVISLVVISFLSGRYFSGSTDKPVTGLTQNEEMAMLKLSSENSIDRIDGLHEVLSSEATYSDRLIDQLIKRASYDEDLNVRFIAVESLRRYSSKPNVQKALFQLLKREKDTAILILVIDLLQSNELPESQKAIDQLTKDPMTDPLVVDYIQRKG